MVWIKETVEMTVNINLSRSHSRLESMCLKKRTNFETV